MRKCAHWWMPATVSILPQRQRQVSIWIDCCGCAATNRQPCQLARNVPIWELTAKAGFAFSHALEQVLKVTDLLLQGGGFGMVVLDLGDIPAESARRIPLTSWFRFRRAVEPTATVLLLVEQEPCARTCASLLVRLHPVSIFTSDSSSGCRWGAKPIFGGAKIRTATQVQGTWPAIHSAAQCSGPCRSVPRNAVSC